MATFQVWIQKEKGIGDTVPNNINHVMGERSSPHHNLCVSTDYSDLPRYCVTRNRRIYAPLRDIPNGNIMDVSFSDTTKRPCYTNKAMKKVYLY